MIKIKNEMRRKFTAGILGSIVIGGIAAIFIVFFEKIPVWLTCIILWVLALWLFKVIERKLTP